MRILVEGLKYHEHDGHNMPKKVAREALEALGVEPDDQP
jgi:methylmalonyl-CoA mutase cobalamin-binding subunit